MLEQHTEIGGAHPLRQPLADPAPRRADRPHATTSAGTAPATRTSLEGDAIPLAGRITAVADVFDVLAHPRPHKKAWPLEQAVEEILDQAGQQFDPEVVAAFRRLDARSLLEPVEDQSALRRAA